MHSSLSTLGRKGAGVKKAKEKKIRLRKAGENQNRLQKRKILETNAGSAYLTP